MISATRDFTSRKPEVKSRVALITDHPARMANLRDRGRLEPELRADLVRVRVHEDLAIVREVWRQGERVA